MTRRSRSPDQSPEHPGSHTTEVRIVSCPQCGGDSVYAPSNGYRPFCSQRCKDIDFGAWADESFKVPENPDAQAASHGDDNLLQ